MTPEERRVYWLKKEVIESDLSDSETDEELKQDLDVLETTKLARADMTPEQRREYWLRTGPPQIFKKEGYKAKKKGKGKKGPGVKKDYVLRMEVEGEMIVLNKDSIQKIVKDIVETRGKQRVKNKENISQLRLILEFFKDRPIFQLETYTLLIPIQFDYFKMKN